MKIFMAAAAASTSGQSREEHKWDLLGLPDSCQHFVSWSDTARLTISQRSSERILSFEFINLGNFLSKVSLTAHTGKKSKLEAPEAVISAPLLTFGRISVISVYCSLSMSFPVCSPKVTPCLHFPWSCSQAELSGGVSSESFMGCGSLLRGNEPTSTLKQLFPSTLSIHVYPDQGLLINRGHNPLGGLLGLATSSYLKKWSIPHEESEVKKIPEASHSLLVRNESQKNPSWQWWERRRNKHTAS